jgi:hypothetical protein
MTDADPDIKTRFSLAGEVSEDGFFPPQDVNAIEDQTIKMTVGITAVCFKGILFAQAPDSEKHRRHYSIRVYSIPTGVLGYSCTPAGMVDD